MLILIEDKSGNLHEMDITIYDYDDPEYKLNVKGIPGMSSEEIQAQAWSRHKDNLIDEYYEDKDSERYWKDNGMLNYHYN